MCVVLFLKSIQLFDIICLLFEYYYKWFKFILVRLMQVYLCVVCLLIRKVVFVQVCFEVEVEEEFMCEVVEDVVEFEDVVVVMYYRMEYGFDDEIVDEEDEDEEDMDGDEGEDDGEEEEEDEDEDDMNGDEGINYFCF